MTTGLVVDDRGDAVEAVVVGAWSPESEQRFLSGGATRLVLNEALGFQESSLEFLRGLPVRELVLVDRRVRDLAPLMALVPTLEALHLTTDPSLPVDVSAFTRLVDLAADWAQVRATIAAATGLRRLYLGRFRGTDLTVLRSHQGLRQITLKDRPSLRTLDGVQDLPDLERLGVFRASGLHDLSALRSCSGLTWLELQNCGRLSRLDDLSACVGLRFLNVSECAEIASLGPLRGLDRLEVLHLFGSTRVMDGDLGPVADLPGLAELRMQDRREYRPRVTEIVAGLPR